MTVASAVFALAQAAVPSAEGFDGAVPDEPVSPYYFVLYAGYGTIAGRSYKRDPVDGVFRFQLSCFAPTRDESGWMAEQITLYLLSNRPVADGWVCSKPENEYSDFPTYDEDVVAKAAVQHVARFKLRAFRA